MQFFPEIKKNNWYVYPAKFSVEILYKHYNLQVFVIIELVYNNNVIVE